VIAAATGMILMMDRDDNLAISADNAFLHPHWRRIQPFTGADVSTLAKTVTRSRGKYGSGPAVTADALRPSFGSWVVLSLQRGAASRFKARRHVSVSGKGNCHDNSVVDTFFKSVKAQMIRRTCWKTRC
jgi:hypothetical protein